jgi:hypothetical protein
MRVHGEKLGTSGRVYDVAGQVFSQYELACKLNPREYKFRRCLTYSSRFWLTRQPGRNGSGRLARSEIL